MSRKNPCKAEHQVKGIQLQLPRCTLPRGLRSRHYLVYIRQRLNILGDQASSTTLRDGHVTAAAAAQACEKIIPQHIGRVDYGQTLRSKLLVAITP